MNAVKYPLLTLAFLATIIGSVSAQQHVGEQLQLETLAVKSAQAIERYPDSVRIFATSGLELAKVSGDLKMIADFKKFLGIGFWLSGEGEQAIFYLRDAIEDNQLLKRSDELAVCLSDLGSVYAKYGDYIKAIELHLEAISVAEQTTDDELLATIHNNLGIIYKDNNKLSESLAEYQQAANLYQKVSAQEKLAGCLINIGNVEAVREEFVSAQQYYLEALKFFEESNHFRGQASAYNNLADVSRDLGNIPQSKYYGAKAMLISQSHGFKDSEVIALAGAGESAALENNVVGAISYFHEGIEKAKASNSASELLRLYAGISAAYEQLSDQTQALTYFKRYSNLKDSLFTRETQSYLANLRVVSELGAKDAELGAIQQRHKLMKMSRNVTIGAASGLLLLLGLIIYSLKQKRNGDRILLENQELKHKAKEERSRAELLVRQEREEELSRELDFRSRALTTYTLNLVQKNGLMEEIRTGLLEMLKESSPYENDVRKLIRLVDYGYSLDKDWDGFKTYFEQVHPDFFTKIKQTYPQISITELRLCALIRLSLSIKEAATILNIAPDSVKVARHRIRKKLSLDSDASITDFIMSI